jgi:hypothetical protein
MQLPCGYAPLHFQGNQRSGRQTAVQGACNRPTVKRPFIFAVSSGQRGEPPRKKRTTVPRLCAPSAPLQLVVQLGGPSPHVMQPARRLPCVKKLHRRLRQCHVFSELSWESEKINFQNQCNDSRQSRAWPNSAIKYDGHGPVSHGNRCNSWHGHRQDDSNCSNRRAEAAIQPPIRLWSHLQARILPWGGPGGHFRYSKSGVPSPTTWRRRTHATSPSHTRDGAWPHRMGSQRATRGKKRQHIPVSPDPLRRIPDPYTYKSGASGYVRTSAGSRNKDDPGMSRGPVLTRVWALPSTSRSGGDPLLVAHDISYRVEPDVKSWSPCIYWGRAACHCTNGRHALSSFNVSRPIRWQAASRSSSRRRACWVCWQTVRQCRAACYTHPPFYRKLPLHVEDTRISGVRAQEDCLGNRH